MSILRCRILFLILLLTAVPLTIVAQDDNQPFQAVPANPCADCMEYPNPSTNTGGELFAPLTPEDIPFPPSADDELEIPMPGDNQDELEIPMPPDSQDELDIPMPPDSQDELEIPMPGDNQDELEIPMPPVSTTVPPALPVGLVRGYYRQVGAPSVMTEGTCFDQSAGAGGLCAADPSGTNEVSDFNNCWSDDAQSTETILNGERVIPACQSADSESLYLYNQSLFYGRLKGSAYGRGSVNQAMLEQGGVSIGTYSVLEGTQIEIISPTRFVIKYVHREAGGCVRVVSYYYELAEQNETACQHIIEILPEEQPEVVSTPVPLPPVDEDVPYVVTMPVLPDSCTADTRPPDDFTEAQLALDEDGGSLTVNYGSGSFTTYKYLNSQFSFVDHRQGVFRLDLTLYQDYLTWRWFKTGANGAMCTVEGELRPASPTVPEGAAPAPDSPMAVITNNPYTVIWTPVEQFCPPDVFAGMNTFTQASLTAQADGFEIDYGTGSYTLRDESGAGFYSYMHFGDNGSSTLLSLNSHTATAFSLLFQQSDASGQMCMAHVEITQG